MLTDRSEINRVFADQETVACAWWQDGTDLSAQSWSRHVVDSRITELASPAAASVIAVELCGGTAARRWKRSLLGASRWGERPGQRGGLNSSDGVLPTLSPMSQHTASGRKSSIGGHPLAPGISPGR
jgi:hypothetical protein